MPPQVNLRETHTTHQAHRKDFLLRDQKVEFYGGGGGGAGHTPLEVRGRGGIYNLLEVLVVDGFGIQILDIIKPHFYFTTKTYHRSSSLS